MMPLPARAIKSSGGSTVGDRNRVPTPEPSDLGGVFKGMPDTPTGGVVHARDLRKRGIRPWAHGHQRRCARFPRSAVKIGNPRYYELRKPGAGDLSNRLVSLQDKTHSAFPEIPVKLPSSLHHQLPR